MQWMCKLPFSDLLESSKEVAARALPVWPNWRMLCLLSSNAVAATRRASPDSSLWALEDLEHLLALKDLEHLLEDAEKIWQMEDVEHELMAAAPPRQEVAQSQTSSGATTAESSKAVGVDNANQAFACQISKQAPPREQEHWCVLLTATVQPDVDLSTLGLDAVQQKNAEERRAMYEAVLRDWAAQELPVIFAENSGADLKWAERLLSDAPGGGEALSIPRATTCHTKGDIGCHEAHTLLQAVARSKLLRDSGKCTHALKLTGRYFVTSALGALPLLCKGRPVALQNAPWKHPTRGGSASDNNIYSPAKRQESQVMGFDLRLAHTLYGWAERGEGCMECHMTQLALRLRDEAEAGTCGDSGRNLVCELPPLDIRPRREGSTGILRLQLERTHT